MNTATVAEILGVNRGSVLRWIHADKLEYTIVSHPIDPGGYAFDISEYALAKALGGIHIGLLKNLKTIQDIANWLRSNDTTVLEFVKDKKLRVVILPHIPGEALYLHYRIPRVWVEECFGLSMDVQLVTMDAAARYLSVNPKAGMLQRWITVGHLQAIALGNTHRITRDSLVKWKEKWIRTRPAEMPVRRAQIRGIEVRLLDSDIKVLFFLAQNTGTWIWQSSIYSAVNLSEQVVIASKFRLKSQLGDLLYEEVQTFHETRARRLYLMVPFSIHEILFF